MATAEQYGAWIVANKDKRGTPQFETVAAAYKLARSGEPAVSEGPATPSPEQAQPVKPTEDNTYLQQVGQNLGNEAAGLVRGAGSIGATLVAPYDMAKDAIAGKGLSLESNRERRAGIDSGLQTMGAEPDSGFYKAGKLVGELAGTAGVGGAAGNALLRVAPRVGVPLANALATGGFRAGTTPGIANMLTQVAGGAGSGLLGAGLIDPSQAVTGAIIGGALPPAAAAAGRLGQGVARIISPTVDQSTANAVRAARTAGYVIPPTQANPTLINRALEGAAGKLTTAQNASAKNSAVTSKLAARALGLADDVQITPESLNAVRRQAGQAYDAIGSTGTVITGRQYDAALSAVVEPYKKAASGFPGARPPEIVSKIDELRTTEFDASAGIAKIRELREMADAAGRSGDKATAGAYKKASSAIEDALDRHLRDIQAPEEMLAAFRNARQLIAKTYTVEKALNKTTGTIDARKIGAQIEKGRPITGDLKTIGDFANRFKTAAKPPEQMGSLPQVSPLDWTAAGAASIGLSNPFLLSGVLARPAARGLALSPLIQNRLAPSQTNRLAELLRLRQAGELVAPTAYRAAPVVIAPRVKKKEK